MDVLVTLSSSMASLTVMLVPGIGHHIYFETSAVIITLIKRGKLLEARAKGQASTATKKLMDLASKVVHLEDEAGERDVPADSVRPPARSWWCAPAKPSQWTAWWWLAARRSTNPCPPANPSP